MIHFRQVILSPALLAFSISSAALAQDNTCVEITKIIGQNYSRYLDAEQQQSIARADLCTDRYDKSSTSKAVQIEAGFKAFTGKAAGSENDIREEQTKSCDNKFGSYWRNQLKTGEARVVSAEAANIISTCLTMNNENLFPTVEIANDGKDLTMAVQFKPNMQADLRVSVFGPMDLSDKTCSVTKNGASTSVRNQRDVAQTLRPTESISMSCHRESSKKRIDGKDYDCVDEMIFNVVTSGPVKTMKIPRICSQEIRGGQVAELTRRIDELEKELSALTKTTATQNQSINNQLNKIENYKYSIVTKVDDKRRGNYDALSENSIVCEDNRVVVGLGHGRGRNDIWFFCGAATLVRQ